VNATQLSTVKVNSQKFTRWRRIRRRRFGAFGLFKHTGKVSPKQLLKYRNLHSIPKLAVLLRTDQLLFIIAHAREKYPEECCGFLTGTNSSQTIVERVQAARNAAVPPRLKRYRIDPRELIRAGEEARRLNLELVGVYHSHPDAPVEPSRVDLEYAWPNFNYLILSLQGGEPRDVAVWSLNRSGTQFELTELAVV